MLVKEYYQVYGVKKTLEMLHMDELVAAWVKSGEGKTASKTLKNKISSIGEKTMEQTQKEKHGIN